MPAAYTYKIYKKFVAVLMIALLLLLTSMNFFQFPTVDPADQLISMETSGSSNSDSLPEENEPSPTGPDEKAPGNPVSISEEYLHDLHEENSSVSDNLIHQLLLVCSKVHPPHTELITPPPDFFS